MYTRRNNILVISLKGARVCGDVDGQNRNGSFVLRDRLSSGGAALGCRHLRPYSLGPDRDPQIQSSSRGLGCRSASVRTGASHDLIVNPECARLGINR